MKVLFVNGSPRGRFSVTLKRPRGEPLTNRTFMPIPPFSHIFCILPYLTAKIHK